MILLKVMLLALVQGITEFLPISSSGHLVMIQHYLGISKDQVTLDVILHAGTLLSILIFFRRDIMDLVKGFKFNTNSFPQSSQAKQTQQTQQTSQTLQASQASQARRYWLFILIAILPAGIAGVMLNDWIEAHLFTMKVVSLAWIFNGLNLWIMDAYSKKEKPLSMRTSLWIGLCQCIAFLPGISRSGTTISAGVYCGLNRQESARFSFLIAIPVIMGATVLKVSQILVTPSSFDGLTLLAGFVIAAISGYSALKILFLLLNQKKFRIFALYCIGLGLITSLYTYL